MPMFSLEEISIDDFLLNIKKQGQPQLIGVTFVP